MRLSPDILPNDERLKDEASSGKFKFVALCKGKCLRWGTNASKLPSIKEETQISNEPAIIYQNEKMKEMENLAKMIIKDGTSK